MTRKRLIHRKTKQPANQPNNQIRRRFMSICMVFKSRTEKTNEQHVSAQTSMILPWTASTFYCLKCFGHVIHSLQPGTNENIAKLMIHLYDKYKSKLICQMKEKRYVRLKWQIESCFNSNHWMVGLVGWLFYCASTPFESFNADLSRFDKSSYVLKSSYLQIFQLNVKTVLFQTIQFCMLTKLNGHKYYYVSTNTSIKYQSFVYTAVKRSNSSISNNSI